MPRIRFKNFSNLGFIQSIDKPRHLRSLLSPYAGYFKRQGIDVKTLNNDDATDRRLLAVFTQPDEEMPRDLLDILYVLDDLTDEAGHDRILAEIERSQVPIAGIGRNLNPGEFAIAVYGKSPGLIRHCHEKTLYRKIRNYYEFQAAEDGKLSLSSAHKKGGDLEKELGPWFGKRNRSEACEIYVYEEEREIKFQITHGRTYRTDGTIEKNLKRSRVAYRPQKHDSVIYSNKTSVLKVSAQAPAERNRYRQTFGKILFGDADHFPAGDIYTLDPLRRADFAIKKVDGVESARLVEVCVEFGGDDGFMQISKGADVIARARSWNSPNLAEGQIVRAAFLIKYSSGGRARRLELRPPNVAIYDRDRDGVPAEKFMDANRLLKLDVGNGDQ